jgi:hypothetical protein
VTSNQERSHGTGALFSLRNGIYPKKQEAVLLQSSGVPEGQEGKLATD